MASEPEAGPEPMPELPEVPAASRPKPRFRRTKITARVLAAAVALTVLLTWISTDHFLGFGGSARGEGLTRVQASPHFVAGQFVNPERTELMKEGSWEATKQWFRGNEMRAPTCPLPLVTDAGARLASPPSTGLRITWLGHSTTLIEIDGQTLLTDPNWSERASPSRSFGPRRFHPPPLPLDALPHVDAVVISHEHFDHLDMSTVRALGARGIPFHVPLGVTAHLEAWGVPRAQIIDHDWWESAPLGGGVALVSTPARHFNGRGIPWRLGSFWTSWSIVGPKHRVFFSGDTGLSDGFREIGRREGPFDVALLEIGQYHPSWGDIHLGPRGALDAFERLGARSLFPIHWASFELALHSWSEPAETLFVEGAKRGTPLLTPRLGEPLEPETDPSGEPWWRSLPPIAASCP